MLKFEEIIKNPTKTTITKYLKTIEEEYSNIPSEKKEIYLNQLQSMMFFIIFNSEKIFKENYGNRRNIYNISIRDYWLVICWDILSWSIETFQENISSLLERVQIEWSKKANYNVPDNTINELLDLAEIKFNLIRIIENSSSSFFYFNIPYKNKYAESNLRIFPFKKDRAYLFELYGEGNEKLPLELSFSYSLGQSLFFYILEKKPKIIKEFKKEFSVQDDKVMEKFSDIFAIALLQFTEYDIEQIDIKVREKYTRYIEKITSQLNSNESVPKNELCPCGSGKKYKHCCLKKELKWVRTNGQITKKLPITKNINSELNKFMKVYENWLGREPYKYERIFDVMGYSETNYENILAQFVDIPTLDLSLQYATLKTGMFLSEYNYKQFSDLDLQEWHEAITEFKIKNAIKLPTGNSIFEEVKATNLYLNSITNHLNNIDIILSKYINHLSDFSLDFTHFQINNQHDFSIICARKIIIDSRILLNSYNHKSIEEVTNITRIIYEDLIQTEIFLKDKELFEEKIKPIELLEKGILQYKKNTEGKNSKHRLINNKIQKEYNIKINISDLSLKSKYKKIYDEIFDGLSSFIHLNAAKIPQYFNRQNPLTEVQEYKSTSLLGLFLLNQCIFEIKNNISLDRLLLRDMEYIYTNNSIYIKQCIEKLTVLEPNNDVYHFINHLIDSSVATIKKENTITL